MTPEERIRRLTSVQPAPLCPEIRLHLATPALWRARPEDLGEAGIADPFWAFCWPGGQALARHVLDHPAVVRGRAVLDFGAGGGVEAVAAALSGAGRVRAADVDPLAAVAVRLNADLAGVCVESTTDDLVGDPLDGWDLILAGDVCYGQELTDRVQAWLASLARAGKTVLLADPGRGFLRPGGLVPVASYEAVSEYVEAGTARRSTGVFTFPG